MQLNLFWELSFWFTTTAMPELMAKCSWSALTSCQVGFMTTHLSEEAMTHHSHTKPWISFVV
jgi:hypothetical protein